MRRAILSVALILALTAGAAIGFVARTSLLRLVPVVALVCALPGIVEVWRKRDRVAVSLLLLGILLAPAVATVVHLRSHRVVHVDDAFDEPIQLWIDGERSIVVDPTAADGEPPRVRIPFGRHRFGWSEVGAPHALHEIDADVSFVGEHLYSPGRAGCYWLEVTAYGEGSTHDIDRGPQPVRELLHFERVDVWFGPTPKTVSAPFSIGAETRVAVQRYGLCMELAAKGCSPDARDAFVECQTSLRGPGEPTNCFAEAKKRCDDEEKPKAPKLP